MESTPARALAPWHWMRHSAPDVLWTLLLVAGCGAGVVVGVGLRVAKDGGAPYHSREVAYVRLAADLWINALRALALPLMVTSAACAVFVLGMRPALTLVGLLCAWAVLSKLAACALALGFAAALRPGAQDALAPPRTPAAITLQPGWLPPRARLGESVLDLLNDALVDNPVEACVRHSLSTLRMPPAPAPANATNETEEEGPPPPAEPGVGTPEQYEEVAPRVYVYQPDGLGVAVGTLVVGVAMALLAEKAVTLVLVSAAVRDACLLLTALLLTWAAPFVCVAVVAELMGAQLHSQGPASQAFPLALLPALLLPLCVLYPCALLLSTRRWPFLRLVLLCWHTVDVLVVAMVTRSAHAALPVALYALLRKESWLAADEDMEEREADEEKEAEKRRMAATNETEASVALLVALGSAWNCDGSAAWLTMAGVWGAQRHAVADGRADATGGQYGAALGLGVLTSVATGGEATMHAPLLVTLLTAMGASTRPVDVAPLLATAWATDALASAVNILGCVFAAAVVTHFYLRVVVSKRAKRG